MRKCLRCNSDMIEECDLKVHGGAYGTEVAVSEKILARRIGKPKIAICPKCGEISIYTDNIDKLKESINKR